MTKPALVSIIVRTQGKRPALLAEALQSLADQSYPALEVIVVEDGAANAAAAIMRAQAARPGAFVHLPIDKAGRCGAGNAGLARAEGALIGFLDEDDALAPEHIALLAETLARRTESDLAYARARPLFCEGLGEDRARTLREGAPTGDAPFSRTLLWLRNSIAIQAALFRRALYERCGGLDAALEALEDWDLWLRYSAEKDFIGLEAVTSSYRLPAAKAALKARAAAHEPARRAVIAKHAALEARHRFADIAALPARIRGEIPFREALALAGAALRAKLSNSSDAAAP